MKLEQKLQKIKPYTEKAESVFLVLFFVYVSLGFNNLTVGTKIVSVFMWPTYLLGAALLGMRFLQWKDCVRMPGLFALLALCAVGAVSIALNLQYDVKGNLVHLIFWAFYFLLCYLSRESTDTRTLRRRFTVLFHMLCAVAFVLTAISFGMMIFDYAKKFTLNGDLVRRGFLGGRLFGAYQTPNAGAVIGSIVTVGSVHFIRVYKNKLYTAFAVINCLLQFAYLVFSDSRTGRVCYALACAVYLFFALREKRGDAFRFKQAAVALTLSAAVIAGGYFLPKWVQIAYNFTANTLDAAIETEAEAEAKKEGKKEKDKLLLGRKESLDEDYSNGRIRFWKSGVEIFLQKPLFGHTFKGFLPYAQENLPDTFLVKNDYLQLNTLDNDVMNLMVSNGIAGLVCFAAFVILILRRLLLLFRNRASDPLIPLLLAVCAAAAASSLFSSGVLYMQCQYSLLFWVALGLLMRFETETERKPDRIAAAEKEA